MQLKSILFYLIPLRTWSNNPRQNGTNPRQNGTNPRQNGTNPRQNGTADSLKPPGAVRRNG